MSEIRKYFDLEIGDDIIFYVDSEECHYPMTFTVAECIEEYCEMQGVSLVRIAEDVYLNGQLRSGTFWYERQESFWTDAFSNVRNVQQTIMRMRMSMEEVADVMRRVGVRNENSYRRL